MRYRLIVVDGVRYKYIITKTHVEISGVGAYPIESIGEATTPTSYRVSSKHLENTIRMQNKRDEDIGQMNLLIIRKHRNIITPEEDQYLTKLQAEYMRSRCGQIGKVAPLSAERVCGFKSRQRHQVKISCKGNDMRMPKVGDEVYLGNASGPLRHLSPRKVLYIQHVGKSEHPYYLIDQGHCPPVVVSLYEIYYPEAENK